MAADSLMRARAPLFAFAVLVLFCFPVLLGAHHSTAEYDLKHPATANGVVTRFDWVNPHVRIFLDVAGDNWIIEIDSPNALGRMGWSKDSLKPGDKITCSGARAKDGSPRMRCTQVTLADGTLLQSF
jgi:hypothetical protein